MKRIALLLAVFAGGCALLAGDSSGAATNYPSPLKLRNVAGSVTGSWLLGTVGGSSDTTTSNVSIDNSADDGWYAFAPGVQTTTRLASIPTSPDGKGFIIDPAGGATGFPAGTWVFTVRTNSSGATADAAVLTVGMWKGTISGSTFTPTGTIVAPTDDPGSHNLHSGADVTVDASYAVPRFSLAAGETLFVELWRHQVAGISDAADANRELDLVVNDGSSKITHPAADDTAPHHVISITKVSGSTAFDAGTNTLYYLGSSAGSFKIKDAITDGGSGPLDVTYPLVPTAGWTHPAETISGAPSFTSSIYSWTAGSVTSPGAQSIVAEDNALQTSTATLTLTNDTSGPTGQSVSLNGGPTFSTLSVPLELVDGTDAGAGVDSASARIERSSASLTGGSCGTFGSWGTITLAGGADTGVTAGNCYRYRYTVYDRLGNASSPSAPSATALVDGTSSPTVAASGSLTLTLDTPTELSGPGDQYYSGGTLWFRPAGTGSFSLNATAKDAQSGVASVVFPNVSDTSGWSGSTGGTDTSSTYSSPVAYTWTAGAAAPGAKPITATNGAGQNATVNVTISADSTPPTGQTIAVSGGPSFSTTTVPLAISRGTDAGSGIDSSGDAVERAEAPLRDGACGTFGTFTAVTLVAGADTTVKSGNCYRWQVKVSDNVGNMSAPTATTDAKVDTTPPSMPQLVFTGLSNAGAVRNVVYYRPATNGNFTVSAVSSDPESGGTTYAFPTIPGTTQLGTGASRTFLFTSSFTAPPGPLTVTATNAGGLTSEAGTFTLVPDPTPPTTSVRCNGGSCAARTFAGPVRVTISGDDGGRGSGVRTIRYTTNGETPTARKGFEYFGPIVVRRLTRLKVRAFDRAANAGPVVAVEIRSLADTLVFDVPASVSVLPAARFLLTTVASTQRVHVVAVMSGRGLSKPQRWGFILERGAWHVRLRLPEKVARGPYTLRWAVSFGAIRSTKVTQVTLR